MAEAIVNSDPDGYWYAYSAGTEPADIIHPLALQVLEEIGIYHQGEPNHVNEYKEQKFDLVITVCDNAAEECPVWLGSGKVVHKSFIDPAAVEGTDQEVIKVFQDVRNQIQLQVPQLLDDYINKEGNDD
jgi:arsenate reductase